MNSPGPSLNSYNYYVPRSALPLGHEQSGSILILFLLILAPLVLLAGIAVNRAYSRFASVEIQVAVDLAAISAASTLCSSKACYQDSQEAALRTLASYEFLEAENLQTRFDGQPSNRTLYDSGKFRVTVERGRWWPRGLPSTANTDAVFESFDRLEGVPWSDEHPGIPVFLAANAVRVSVLRKQVGRFFGLSGSSSYELLGTAVATGGDVDRIMAAPFALPACALLDPRGEFSARANCTYRRYFARADRYCSAANDNDDCGVLPNMDWDWAPDGSCIRYWGDHPNEQLYCPVSESCKPGDCHSAGGDYWQLYPEWSPDSIGSNTCAGMLHLRFAQLTDAYGVIGVPSASGVPPIEASIRDTILRSPTGLVPASIGDEFRILASGFVERDTHQVLQDLIASNALIEGSPEGGATAWFFSYHGWRLPKDDGSCGCKDAHLLQSSEPPCDGNALYYPPQIGYCNTLRYKPFTIRNRPDEHCEFAIPMPLMLETSGWSVPIPVIANADSSATACGEVDPPVSPGAQWQVIGFIHINIFDADIGADPPRKPAPLFERGAVDSCSGLMPDFDAFPVAEWGFHAPGGITRCNNFVARTSCATRLIPSSQFRGRTTTRLVQ